MKLTTQSILASILSVLFLSSSARAQNDAVSVNARISQSQSYVGEILEYQIVVINAQPSEQPEIDWPSGVRASFQGSNTISQKFSTLDPQTGRMKLKSRNTMLMTYRLVSKDHGQFTIPETQLTINGQSYPVNPVTFTILDPPEADDFDLVVELDRTTVFVGETLRLRVHWYLTSSVSEYSFRPSVKPDSFEVTGADDSARTARRSELYPIDIFGVRTVGRLRDSTYKGKKTRVLYFELLIQPTEPGTFDLGPMAVLFDRRTTRNTNVRTISRSDILTLTVKAPPLAGQPEGYTGLIGNYTIRAQAAPTTAHVGEPIDLTVTVRGTEPITRVRTGPDLRAMPRFTDDFRLSPDGWQREPSHPGERVFTTKIRATSGEVFQIPPIRLPFFDPVKAEYQTAQTQPIELDIESVRTTTIEDAIGTAGTAQPAAAPSIDRAGPIFWAEDRGTQLLRRDPVSVLGIASSPVWISAVAVPPATYAIAFVLGTWRRTRNPQLARTLIQLRLAHRAATHGELADAAHKAVEATLGITPDAITSADAKRLPIADEHRECLASVLETQESDFDDSGHTQHAVKIDPSRVADAINAIRISLKRGVS